MASYAAALLAAGTIVAFLLQAGVLELLNPEDREPPPAVERPEQITAGPSTVSGFDSQNLPYSFTAARAVQDKDIPHHVHLEAMSGRFQRPGGQSYDVAARTGLYDTKRQTLNLADNVRVTAAGRFEALMEDAVVAVRDKTLTTGSPVKVVLDNGGTIVANGLKISDDGNHIVFLDGVKASFKASATKGDAQP